MATYPECHISHFLDKDKSDEIIRWGVHRSLGIQLTTERNPVRRQFDEDSETSHCLKWGTVPPMYFGRITQTIKDKEGKNELKNEQDGQKWRMYRGLPNH